MSYTVGVDSKGKLVVETPYCEAGVLRRVPDAKLWDASKRVWKVVPSRVNIEFLRREIPKLTWLPSAAELADSIMARGVGPAKLIEIGHIFRQPPPYHHQREAFARSIEAPGYALLMEQRTGKTRVIIDTAAYLWGKSKIDLVVVLCPNSVKSTWEEQIPEWIPEWCPASVHVYRAGKLEKAQDWLDRLIQHATGPGGHLGFLVANVELLQTKKGFEWLQKILPSFRALGVIDEASRFKNHSAQRTKYLLKLRPLFQYRRLATGTLITQGPLDAWAPFTFLDPAILGYSSFYAFRNEFAILGGYMNKQVVGYANTDKLADLIKPFSYRVTRDQCFDLPAKVYSKLEVELNPEQRRLYNQMRDEMLAEFDDTQRISATIALTQLLRLQQIVGGFLPLPPTDDGRNAGVLPIPGENPKLTAILDALEESNGKTLIWARFRAEIGMIVEALRLTYGDDRVVEFHGGIPEEERTAARRRFQDAKDPCRFFIGQTEAGGVGIALDAARDVIYFSNSFSLESRLQSEDRAQAGHKKVATGYIDIVAKDTLDVKVLNVLRGKKSLADIINSDPMREWV